MRIEDVQQIATRAGQLLRLCVGHGNLNILTADCGRFVPTAFVTEQAPGQFVATATLTQDGEPFAGMASPGVKVRAIGFTRGESLDALADAILQHVDKVRVSHERTVASCRDNAASLRLAAASRRAKIVTLNVALKSADPRWPLTLAGEALGYEGIEIGAWRVAGDGAWKAVAQGRGIYCEAHSDTSFHEALLSLAARLASDFFGECERCEMTAMKADRKAVAYELLHAHVAAEAAQIASTIREATRR